MRPYADFAGRCVSTQRPPLTSIESVSPSRKTRFSSQAVDFRCEFALKAEFEHHFAPVSLDDDLRLALVHTPLGGPENTLPGHSAKAARRCCTVTRRPLRVICSQEP